MGRDHDKGQSDHNAGKYEPPTDNLTDVLNFFVGTTNDFNDGRERNNQYDAGYQNAHDQATGKK